MTEHEGVIKYQLDYTHAPPVAADLIREINAWRKILWLLNMIGQDVSRYDGFGYGNVSQRLNPSSNRFLISGTQTAHIENLGTEHYSLVDMCDPIKNYIKASGPVRPSSEALTHAAIYSMDPAINYVFHVHSPIIWRKALDLEIPVTSRNVSYGTPEMAAEFEAILNDSKARQRQIIVMGGHEDGIVSFGKNAEQAGQILISYYSRALQIIKN